jgi:hypothetical protein
MSFGYHIKTNGFTITSLERVTLTAPDWEFAFIGEGSGKNMIDFCKKTNLTE